MRTGADYMAGHDARRFRLVVLPSAVGRRRRQDMDGRHPAGHMGIRRGEAAAWDCAATATMPLDSLRRHPRTGDILETLRRWNDARRRGLVTEDWKRRLRDCGREHHLLQDGKGGYELVEWEQLPVAGGKDTPVRAFLYEKDGHCHVVHWHVSGNAKVDLGANHGVLDVANKNTWTASLPRDEVIRLFANAKIVGQEGR